MDQNFSAAYKQLNLEQQAAVDAIDGPVLVVAGPGTGKTQLLSLRVANILQKTDTDAGSVLCLTFTNFAATNMRERLARLIGASAHNVIVRTFHSFAAEVMNLYPDYFWNGARLGLAPDAIQLDIVQTILADLPLDNPLALKFAGAFTMLDDVQSALKLTKEAGLSPGKLQAMVEANIAYINQVEATLVSLLDATLSFKKLPALLKAVQTLPDQPIDDLIQPLISLSHVIKSSLETAIMADESTGKTTNTGKWKRRWLQTVNGQKGMFDEGRRNSWWLALVEVYAAYRDALHAGGYYDYSDMILEVISQLEQQPELLASVQERFLYVLIDEFQDTNKAQMRLADLVARHPADEGRPNLMAVGDDDQSIYAFNGAELSNMLSFTQTYSATQVIVLQENYRSAQTILDAAKSIIEQADDRLVKRDAALSKNLRAANQSISDGTIRHTVFPTREHQFAAIAHGVQQSWQQASADGQSIVVLARSHDSLQRLSAQLIALQVPIRYEYQSNILDQEIVQYVVMLAETVLAIVAGDTTSVNHHLAIIIRHPMWNTSPAVLWQLAQQNFHDPDWLQSLLDSKTDSLAALGNWLVWLAQQADRQPLAVMLEYLLGLQAGEYLTSPVREYYLALREVNRLYLDALSGAQILQQLCRELTVSQPARLADFVHFYQLNHEMNRTISDESWFGTGEKAVQLMTIHKAKGLEFDIVYILDATDDAWRPHHIGRKPPANLPLQPYGELFDDYVRLLYVAVTRAKQSCYVSSFSHDTMGKAILATPLVSALPLTIADENEFDEPIQLLETSLHWPSLNTGDMRSLLQSRLADFQLSPTAFLTFLDVTQGGPQNFLERQLLKLPQPQTTSLAFGTAIHAALQTAQVLINNDDFNLDMVAERYDTVLQAQQLPVAAYERYQTHGYQLLQQLFTEPALDLPKDAQAEVSLRATLTGDDAELISLYGKLDHLNANADNLIISDYKTGKPLHNFETRDKNMATKAWRHKTQLLFYALLARESGRYKNAQNLITQMIYVEAETNSERIRKLAPSNDDLSRLRALIQVVWQHVLALDFPDTSAYENSRNGIDTFEQDLLNKII